MASEQIETPVEPTPTTSAAEESAAEPEAPKDAKPRRVRTPPEELFDLTQPIPRVSFMFMLGRFAFAFGFVIASTCFFGFPIFEISNAASHFFLTHIYVYLLTYLPYTNIPTGLTSYPHSFAPLNLILKHFDTIELFISKQSILKLPSIQPIRHK